MDENFDAPGLANKLVEQSRQLLQLQTDMDKDPLVNAPKYIPLENQVADKIREEISPFWSDPEKLRSLGIAMREKGAKVETGLSDALPTEFNFSDNEGDEHVSIDSKEHLGWFGPYKTTRVWVHGLKTFDFR